MALFARSRHIHGFVGFGLLCLALVSGCDSVSRRNAASDDGVNVASNGDAGADTLLATIEDPDYGTYELVARDANDETGKWYFTVRAGRSAPAKNDLRFVWDFGDGAPRVGVEQAYTFTSPGTYLIVVRALKSDGGVAFELKLQIEVDLPVDLPPAAVAGDDQDINENELVFLFAGDSSDPDGDELSFNWVQTAGPPVQLLHANEATASFIAPIIDADIDVSFRVNVSDGTSTSQDDVVVHVHVVVDPADITLTADAGPDQEVTEGDTVALTASTGAFAASTGAAPAFAYQWTQIGGPAVGLMNADQAIASFRAPAVADGSTAALIFELLVFSGDLSAADEARVTVLAAPTGSGGEPGGSDPCAVDTDGDGVVDCNDGCPTDANKGAPGRCGCGVAETDSDRDTTPDCIDGCPSDRNKTEPGICGCGVSDDDPNCGGVCRTSSIAWSNTSFAPQSGSFEMHFDATPDDVNIDAVIALSRGAGTSYSSFAVLVRFNLAGTIDVRNGGSYVAATSIAYVPGTRYHFRSVVDVPAHMYNTFVTPQGSSERILGTNLAFRTEQNTVESLGNWGMIADPGTVEVCNFAIGGATLTANAGPDVAIAPGNSTTLSGSGFGGRAPYAYRWSPSTGLSSTTVAQPTATPTVTTTYTLTVTDAASETATDTVTVTVAIPPLTANAGSDRNIATGASVTLSGSASGGSPPHTYSWSPTTGLSSSTVAQPIASPAATTTYTLTVRDSQARTASDSVNVTVGTTTGTTYYVAKNATNASDTNPGTEASPWKTLAKGTSTARAGDTVLVKAGTYAETLRPMNSGSPGALITFRAYPGDECQGPLAGTKIPGSCKVILDGQSSRGQGVDLSRPVSYVRVDGVEIRNHTDAGITFQAWGDRGVEGIEIVNNYIHDNGGDAIDARNAVNTLIAENEIYANGLTGVTFGGQFGAVGLTVHGNAIHYNGKDGVQGAGRQIIIEKNRLYNQFHTDLHQDGMDLADVHGIIIRQNTIFDFTQLVYIHNLWGASDNIEVYGNVMYTNRYWTVHNGEAPGFFVDARFTSAPVSGIAVHSNTFGWVGYGAIWIMGSTSNQITNVRVQDNIFYQSNVDIDGSAVGLVSDYNLYYVAPNAPDPENDSDGGPDSKSLIVPSFEGPHSLRGVDPLFMGYDFFSNFDFHLTAIPGGLRSRAIDAGNPQLGTVVTIPPVFEDIDGRTRPAGAAFDIGAYEK